jgi:hypothetical protein
MTREEAKEILKVEDDDSISDCFKAQAKIHHPDVGGDREQFELIRLAYDTLKQKEKVKTAEELLLSTFRSIVGKAKDPLTINLIDRTKGALVLQQEQLAKQIVNILSDMSLTNAIVSRVVCHKENDIISSMLLEHYVNSELAIYKLKEETETIKEALRILTYYDYTYDKPTNNFSGGMY